MSRLANCLALAFVLSVAPQAVAAAQQQQLYPEAISDSAPTAKQARAVAELLLAGDRQKLETYLVANAAPSWTGSATYAAELTQMIETLKTGARTIVRMDGLGKIGVAAALGTSAGGDPERAIVVRMDPAAPHRITGLGLAQIQGE